MLDKIILDSINDHMDLLASLQGWMLVIALAAIYTIITDADSIDLRVLKVKRRHAGILFVLLYAILQFAVFICFSRIILLTKLLPDSQILVAFTKLSTQSWLMNPFAYFDDQTFIQPAVALVGLTVTWWLSFFAAYMLRSDDQPETTTFIAEYIWILPLAVTFSLGVSTYAQEEAAFSLLVERVAVVAPSLGAQLTEFLGNRKSLVIYANAIAFAVISLATSWIERYLKKLRVPRSQYEGQPLLPIP